MSDDANKRFRREIEIARHLQHDHVIELYEHGRDGDAFWFAAELCDSGSLVDRVRGRLPVSVDEAVRIAIPLLESLAYVHTAEVVTTIDGEPVIARDIVHRDIKPLNILFNGEDLKLADLGLAKASSVAGLSTYTMGGFTAGTPMFMARSQLTMFRETPRSADVWAAAAVIYWLLTGKVPRSTDDPLEWADHRWVSTVLDKPARPITEHSLLVPDKLAEVIDAALDETGTPAFAEADAFLTGLLAALPGGKLI